MGWCVGARAAYSIIGTQVILGISGGALVKLWQCPSHWGSRTNYSLYTFSVAVGVCSMHFCQFRVFLGLLHILSLNHYDFHSEFKYCHEMEVEVGMDIEATTL